MKYDFAPSLPPNDLRAWIDLLAKEGELAEVDAEVDPHLEITEIVNRVIQAGGPALLFRHPKGSQHPLLINQFGTERRMCLAFGEPSLNGVSRKFEDLLGAQPQQGMMENARGLAGMRRRVSAVPKMVEHGCCQERVIEPDLDCLPIQQCWPGDAAPFITLPIVITKDPRTGARNAGIYRMQKIDARTCFIHWQVHKHAASHWREMGDRLEVAVAIGCDPVTTYMAAMPLPKDLDEFVIAGYLRGYPVELIKAKTVDLEVPANAEIILEGYVNKDDLGIEGPFGDHLGYYSLPEPFPVFHLTCMTMRRDAIYPSFVVGPPPAEDAWIGKTTERLFLPMLRMAIPDIVDYDLPVDGAFQHCVIVAIRKAYPGHAKQVMHAVWGYGALSLVKTVIVVDDIVNVHDYKQVFFHVCANIDPKRDFLIFDGPLDQLDHAASISCYGGKLGIDGTQKWRTEGAREWPQRIEMSDQIRDYVDQRWSEYGINIKSG